MRADHALSPKQAKRSARRGLALIVLMASAGAVGIGQPVAADLDGVAEMCRAFAPDTCEISCHHNSYYTVVHINGDDPSNGVSLLCPRFPPTTTPVAKCEYGAPGLAPIGHCTVSGYYSYGGTFNADEYCEGWGTGEFFCIRHISDEPR